AAYRHFASREALLQAVRAAALSALAVSMESELGRVRPAHPRTAGRRAESARAGLRAVGTAYLRFAQAEPGLFRTAFAAPGAAADQADPGKAGRSGLDPFQLLGAALDRMVEAGAPNTSPGPPCTASPCWSSTGRCAASPAGRSAPSASASSPWSRRGFRRARFLGTSLREAQPLRQTLRRSNPGGGR